MAYAAALSERPYGIGSQTCVIAGEGQRECPVCTVRAFAASGICPTCRLSIDAHWKRHDAGIAQPLPAGTQVANRKQRGVARTYANLRRRVAVGYFEPDAFITGVCDGCLAACDFLLVGKQHSAHREGSVLGQCEIVREGAALHGKRNGIVAAGQPNCVTAPAVTCHTYTPICNQFARNGCGQPYLRIHRHILPAAI